VCKSHYCFANLLVHIQNDCNKSNCTDGVSHDEDRSGPAKSVSEPKKRDLLFR
jgi:hypothetical protein